MARSLLPQLGHLLGITKAFSLPVRLSRTGAKTSGITSPAFRIRTVSPIKIPLRTISWALCNVAFVTVDPATLTGSM